MAAKLHYKLRAGVDRAAGERLARSLRQAGAGEVRRLLPGEKDPELAALFTVECGQAEPEELLRHLRSAPEVEFAEHSPRRKPLGQA